ncbi:hypothetical protein BpHYR1_037993 [Brachionus plicatilis]|uniref:Uncharacterized protein n=1 Tax=Brachionus plicatilis TaxID=10195 RepID=A0A3M7PIK3_BRAPC|nr:hypothetical protein BpHYR1_037993 [Brachionus plicatilis]
MNLVLIHFYL